MELIIIVVATVFLLIFGMAILRFLGYILSGVFIIATVVIRFIINLIILLTGIAAILGGVTFIVKTIPQFSRGDFIPATLVGVVMVIIGIILTRVGWAGLLGEKNSATANSRKAYGKPMASPSYDYGRDDDDRQRFFDEWDKKHQAKQEKYDKEREQYWKDRDSEYEAEKEQKAEAWRQEEQAKDDYRREQQEQWEQNQRDRDEYTRQENEKWEQSQREMEEYSRQEREKWQNS